MTNKIAQTAIIFENVRLGQNVVIENYCIIGAIPNNSSSNSETVIGDNSTIRSHTVIYAGNKIGHSFSTGNGVNIRESNNIGNNVSIGTHSIIEHHVVIEDEVRIHSNVFVPEYCTLKKNSWLGPNVVLTNARYPKSPKAKSTLKGVIVEENAKIGANSTILPGIKIGTSALVGAGTVVTKDVMEFQVVVGNPSRTVGDVHSLPY